MSFLNRNSIAGKMLMGLGCVALLAMLVAVARPFEPSATIASEPVVTGLANAAR